MTFLPRLGLKKHTLNRKSKEKKTEKKQFINESHVKVTPLLESRINVTTKFWTQPT